MSDLSDFSDSDFDKDDSRKKTVTRKKTERQKSFKGSEDERKATRSAKSTVRTTSAFDPQPAMDKATGVLSPPDFFISKIFHDAKCFTPKVGHCVVEAKGVIYIFGGEDADKIPTSAMVKFNPTNNRSAVIQ